MDERHVMKIAAELGLAAGQIRATAGLIDEGGTIPFIARYRKEATGSLDEVQVTVLAVDLERKRISLSMKKKPEKTERTAKAGEKPPSGKNPVDPKKQQKEPFNNPFFKAFRREE